MSLQNPQFLWSTDHTAFLKAFQWEMTPFTTSLDGRVHRAEVTCVNWADGKRFSELIEIPVGGAIRMPFEEMQNWLEEAVHAAQAKLVQQVIDAYAEKGDEGQ